MNGDKEVLSTMPSIDDYNALLYKPMNMKLD
jgi:hypothetical protein